VQFVCFLPKRTSPFKIFVDSSEESLLLNVQSRYVCEV